MDQAVLAQNRDLLDALKDKESHVEFPSLLSNAATRWLMDIESLYLGAYRRENRFFD